MDRDFLPGREGQVGGTTADNHLFVDAVIFRYRTGSPWRDLPERYGDWKATHKRFRRWCESGVFASILKDVDALGNPVALSLTPGQAHDITQALPLLERVDPAAFLSDKGYDSGELIETL